MEQDVDSGLLQAGLYVTATPIGCLEDITLRALRVLRSCDRIVCEDPRVSLKLLNEYKIKKPLISYQDYNANKVRPKIIRYLQEKEAIALISDAGTPLFADPGFKLIQECQALGINVTVVVGASALLPAVILSGFAVIPFTFIGFANTLDQTDLEIWQNCNSTLVSFESPHKLVNTINTFARYFSNRRIAVVREITKIHEEVIKGSFDDVLCHFLNENPRGECVIVLSSPVTKITDDEHVEHEIKSAIQRMSLKDSVVYVSQKLGVPKNIVYRQAIKLLGPDI